MNKTISILVGTSVLALGMLAFSPSRAQGAPCGLGGITASGFTLIDGPDCYGALNGIDGENPINGIQGIPSVGPNEGDFIPGGAWNYQNWTFLAKEEGGIPLGEGNLVIDSLGSQTGTWSYNNFDVGKQYALVLKAANLWSVYGFTATATSGGGNWSSSSAGLVNGGGTVFGLSHFSIYEGIASTPVPEPLTLLGSGIALGFGAFMKRKMDKAKIKG
jgi:hypothetical protein